MARLHELAGMLVYHTCKLLMPGVVCWQNNLKWGIYLSLRISFCEQ